MNYRLLIALLIIIFSLNIIIAENDSPIGSWQTVDDKTGRVKSIVEIREENGNLFGKITKLFRLPDENPEPVCDKCKGEKKDKPVLGMTILWDLSRNKEIWSGGKILDPENGKTYKCKIKVIDNGNKLEVRGFIGFSLLGRTQYWERIE